ncbi:MULTISPECIES: S-layer homology domain-containing protein [Paenibacillus]|uniref:S-layer homology domain-containing protein n=1 Tax=Paenibacillus cucumis (ex Kampfer et al. 2016) TaxID=1776858 RepID=A0ABS7KI24_9BACL|nr:S-layer homology domain-containing protein [Paenibacillus cucumis (ex Kampfer et al. 2016)]MBY0203736.1 S-layer homology domain-containing protein [Paenibacillus cucumis (ex Kampfer et al. 2016)]MDP9702120.1 putative repeat protein (TIGR02543 family) [Paenibacillus intestini]
MSKNLNAKKAVSMILTFLLVLSGIPGFHNWGGDHAYAATETWASLGVPGISTGEAEYNSVALDPQNTPYVAFADKGNSGKATVMKFVNGQWQTVGSPEISSGKAYELFLGIDKQGTPYLVYTDEANEGRLGVKRFTAGQWEYVGGSNISPGSAIGMIAFDSADNPYVLYRDYPNQNRAKVVKFTNNVWSTVGTWVTSGDANEMALALDSKDTPYVAYSDGTDNYRLSVKKFDGSAWSYVGATKLTTGQSSNHAIAIAPSDVPYVAFTNQDNSYKTTVLKFTGTQWENVGNIGGISVGSSRENTLAFDSIGTPYVSYSDNGTMFGQRPFGVVKKLSGNQWQPVGGSNFTGPNTLNQVQYVSFALGSDNIPYVAYQDQSASKKTTVKSLTTQYNVSYNGNGHESGSVPVDMQGYSTLSPLVTVAENTGNMEKEGYIFSHWNTAADGTGTDYSPNDTFNINGADVTLYAQWVNGNSDVTFVTNGGTPILSQSVGHNLMATEPSPPSKAGYKFLGWYTDIELTQAYDFQSPVTSNLTLYAKWQSENATLSSLNVGQGTLEPGFSSTELDYQVEVAPEVTSLDFSFSKAETSQTISVTGATEQSVTDDVYSYTASNLMTGLNPVQIKVTAEDGNSNTYNLSVKRLGEPSNNTQLGGLTLNSGTLSPAFSPEERNYQVEVAPEVTSLDFSFSKTETSQTISVTGATEQSVTDDVYSYTASNLMTGLNPVQITVTAEDGNSNTYNLIVKRLSEPSNNADLGGLTLTSGILSPVFSPDVEHYTASVSNSTRSLVVSVTSVQEGASVKINGTSGKSADISLANGRNTVTIEVTAPNGSTKKTYTLIITRSNEDNGTGNTGTGGASNGGGGVTSPVTNNNTSSNVKVLVNGQAQSAGTLMTSTVNGQQVVTISVNAEAIAQKLNTEAAGSVITIPVTGSSSANTGVIIGELNGQTVKLMEDKQAVLVLQTDTASYTLPASQIRIGSVAEQLKLNSNDSLESIKLQVEIAQVDPTTVQAANSVSQQAGYTLVGIPVEFNVIASYNGKTTPVNEFSSYVERTIALPANIAPDQMTTGVVIDKDGSVRHVPTKITIINGAYYAKINSLTNSAYSIVYSPKSFTDVANHWSNIAVNDMSSRMIVSGVSNSNFEPDRSITRAEFAAIVVRALGLKPGEGSTGFRDVNDKDWFADVVKTASKYGLIGGYEDGTFRPQEEITRQEAMTLIARAMKVTGLEGRVPADAAKQLSSFTDAEQVASWAKEAAAASVHTGLVTGRGSNTIAPLQSITRAETATILRRLLQQSDLI